MGHNLEEENGELAPVSRRSHPQCRTVWARRCGEDVAGGGAPLRHQRRRAWVEVEEGNTVTDYDPDEIKRGISVSAALAPVEWRETKVNVIDAPGYADFIGDVKSALRVADAAIIVIDASAGVEVGTEQVWRLAEERGIPRLLFINKMDRENADFGRALASARAAFGNAVAPIQFPVGAEKQFRGEVDLLTEQAHCYTDATSGEFTSGPIPEELKEDEELYRRQLVESIAEQDEELMMRYLEDEPITTEEPRYRTEAVRRERRRGPGTGGIGCIEPGHPAAPRCHRRHAAIGGRGANDGRVEWQ